MHFSPHWFRVFDGVVIWIGVIITWLQHTPHSSLGKIEHNEIHQIFLSNDLIPIICFQFSKEIHHTLEWPVSQTTYRWPSARLELLQSYTKPLILSITNPFLWLHNTFQYLTMISSLWSFKIADNIDFALIAGCNRITRSLGAIFGWTNCPSSHQDTTRTPDQHQLYLNSRLRLGNDQLL